MRPNPFVDVQMVALRTLRGANFWSPRPVTRLDLAVGAYDEISSAQVDGLTDSLAEALPGLVEHRCSIGERGGFLTRLRRGTYLPHIVEHLALELQVRVGHEVGYGRARGGDRAGEYTVVLEHRHAGVGRRAAVLALSLAQHAFARRPVRAGAAIDELRSVAFTDDEPALRRRVVCGVFGGRARDDFRAELLRHGIPATEDVVEVPPSLMLEAGLPYSESSLAVILDLDPGDVPPRYRAVEQAQRLAAVMADGVPPGGIVLAPAGAADLHALILDAGRRVAVFAADGEPDEHDARVAHTLAGVRDGSIWIERVGSSPTGLPLRSGAPPAAQLVACMTAMLLSENGG
jgi:hypothetical protein